MLSAFSVVESSPPIRFFPRHGRPTDLSFVAKAKKDGLLTSIAGTATEVGVSEDPGLDGVVFSGCGHRSYVLVLLNWHLSVVRFPDYEKLRI